MQRNTIRLFLVSISLLTLMPHRAYCSSSLEDSFLNEFEKNLKKRREERIKKFKQIFATLTPQNIDEKIYINDLPRTPLEVVITDEIYREQISPQEYEQQIDLLLALGADPCAGCRKDAMLAEVAAQGNYTIFKKIVARIAPQYIDSGAFKDTIVHVTNRDIEPTSDTVQILADLVDLGATIDKQYRKKYTMLFWERNTPETLQFFLDRGVDPLNKDVKGRTCLCYHTAKYDVSIKNIQAIVNTLQNTKTDAVKTSKSIQARTNVLLLNQAFNAYHVTQHPDGTTSPGWKDTLFGKIFVHACLECFKGNPELIKMIIIQSNKKASLAGKLEKLLKQNQWKKFLIPAITSQLPKNERKQFLAQVPNNLKMTVAQLYQANQKSPE